MAMWLYQLSASKIFEDGTNWTLKQHQKEVCEGQYLEWDTRQIRSINTGTKPKSGDTVIYWFVESGNDNPGLYGIGIIIDYNNKRINHLPIFPNNYLKKHPLFQDDLKDIVKNIQKQMPIATMFEINNDLSKTLWKKLRDVIIQIS